MKHDNGNTFAVIRKELQDIVDEGKPIDIDCQFCDQIYRYTPEEIAEILKEL